MAARDLEAGQPRVAAYARAHTGRVQRVAGPRDR
jgi:hypothetical protein